MFYGLPDKQNLNCSCTWSCNLSLIIFTISFSILRTFDSCWIKFILRATSTWLSSGKEITDRFWSQTFLQPLLERNSSQSSKSSFSTETCWISVCSVTFVCLLCTLPQFDLRIIYILPQWGFHILFVRNVKHQSRSRNLYDL